MPLLESSLQASLIIILTALLRRRTPNKLPKRGFVALWLLAAARMLLPWKFPFRYGVEALLLRAFPALRTLFPISSTPQIARGAPHAVPAVIGATFGPNTGGTLAKGAAATSALDALLRKLSTLSPWRILWLLGLAACALALLLPHLRWRQIYARSLPLNDANVDAWLRAHPLKLRRIRARISDEIPTPLSCGLLRPTILLPASLDRSDAARLSQVLLHECTHIRRLDLLAKLAFAAALCAHWFNPLAWRMYILANRDIELSCDEATLRGLDAPARQSYARTLVELAARQSGLPSPFASGFGGKTIEERIGTIMNGRQTSKRAALLAALLVLLAALGLATSAEEATIPPNPEMEALLFDGWEELSLRDYRAQIYALTPAPDARKGQENYNDPRYTDFLRFVLEPLTEGEWTDGALLWTHRESCGSEDPNSGRSAAFDFRVRCDVPDTSALTAGEFRDKLAAVLNGMEDIDPLAATQASLDARARALAAANSDAAVEFRIEAELREDAPLSEEPANTPEPELQGGQVSPEGIIDEAESTLRASRQSSAELAEALLFEGWERASVRDYAAIIAALPEIEDPDESGLPGGYLQYIYYPLLRAKLDAPQTFSGGSIDAATGEALMNYEVSAAITDPDLLTVGELRDALRGVRQGLERFDCESATQDELQAYAMELAERWSDGEAIAFDILAELPGPDSPYADAQTWAQLQRYAPLGLEFDSFLGNLSLRYRGEAIRAVIDPEAEITISNSAGAEGLGGDGPFLLVEYADGKPAALRPISPEEYAALPSA